MDAHVPPVPALAGRGQTLALVCAKEAVMAAQSQWESMASPPLTENFPGTTSAKMYLR